MYARHCVWLLLICPTRALSTSPSAISAPDLMHANLALYINSFPTTFHHLLLVQYKSQDSRVLSAEQFMCSFNPLVEIPVI